MPAQLGEVRDSLHVRATEIDMEIAMDAVGSGLGDHVQDEPACLAILGVVVVGQDLELLHFLHTGSQGGAADGGDVIHVAAVHVVLVAAVVELPGSHQVGAVAGEIGTHAGCTSS